ncbi:BTB/POZ domain-containing protein KCTD18 [Sciurus carolinensis]|uniref:BTB/POZ domain-containing protein KCTD18 n=1 Tax=Sciurus carolinensis TaxID=30640 RepID=A0AA41SXG4_SCICA|nr:BTB/POZ domain-containing protein KCTD18 [Sciurus carolinensis]
MAGHKTEEEVLDIHRLDVGGYIYTVQVRVSPANAVQISSQMPANQSQSGSCGKAAQRSVKPVSNGASGPSKDSRGARRAENGAPRPPPAKVLLSDKKSTPH